MATTQDQHLDPMAVMRISSAYWHSSVLHTAAALDVFTKLAETPGTAQEVAGRLAVDERGLELILIACVGLGLLEKREGRYANSPLADTFLVKGRPRYQGGIVSMFAEWVPAWSRLKQAVADGKPVVQKQHDQGDEATRAYIMGMLYRGIPQAELLASEVPLSGHKRLLDVGGGPGIFSIIFCQRNAGLRADVFDLPQTLKITKEIIDNYGVEASVSTRTGDYLQDAFGSGYDVVLLSSMINQEGPEVIEQILHKSYDALEPGGLVLIQEQLLNDEKTGPLLATLIGINQLIHTPAGRAYSAREIADLAKKVGFEDMHARPLPDPSPFTLVTGRKPQV
ncbi:MAG TPA: methyltransferase [Pseudodesulfovibrio sp.]|nr:methyltransferase [Pseudodesulfovibrio sp.]